MKKLSLHQRIIAYTSIFFAFMFSFFLMFHTFSYDADKHHIQIASKLWSDFGAHIPLIRSFSYGPNTERLLHGTPIESPLFPGEPIRYHFGFYAIVGLLEKIGVRIDWALNTISALGFFLLLIGIFRLSQTLFSSIAVAALSVLFFLFNGSLSFISFFEKHPASFLTPIDIITNSQFPSFGPWDNGLVTAFWNLNIYTNQRHLALSYGILLIIVYLLYHPPKKLWVAGAYIGILTSILFFINFAAAGIAALFLGWAFLIKKDIRAPIVRAILIIAPAALLLQTLSHTSSPIMWQPGYLSPHTTLPSLILFWVYNLGLHSILIPLGVMAAPKHIRRLLAPPLLFLFVLPNLFQFSTDMINNHKFFNFFLTLGNTFSAYAVIKLIKLWNTIPTKWLSKLLQGLSAIILVVMLTISGIIDFFPIINDTKGNIPDIPKNPDAQFFLTFTKPTDVIANSTWFYHPASIAGRSLLSGYTYFTWSYGYKQVEREDKLSHIYEADTARGICNAAIQNGVTFVELNPNPEPYLMPNLRIWQDLPPAYENQETHLKIYNVDDICSYNAHE